MTKKAPKAPRKKHITLINSICSLLLQVVTIISGFIIPKLILSTFGSETNGLVTSLNQFLNYVSLLEGGLNSVIMSSLYKPLAERDYEKVSSIIKTSTRFFRHISYIFIGYTIVLSIAYPLISNSSFSFGFICSLTMILSIRLFCQYCFSFSYKNLLNASKNGYIVSISQIILVTLNIIAAIVIVKFFPSIHVLKLATACIYIIQPIVYTRAANRLFKLNKHAKPDSKLIANRWDGLSINIAYFIHSNTDVTLLTIFTNLRTVSVYGVYGLVASGITKLINAFNGGIGPSIGNLYAQGDKDKLNDRFDLFEYTNFAFVAFMFGMGILLVTPFVMIYTHNITDTDYFQPIFGILFLLSEAVYSIRDPYVRLSYSAGRFKDLSKPAFIEAIMNIIISLILVNFLGLIGVAIGTLISMSYRTAFQIIYLRKHILHRPVRKFIKRFLIFFTPITLAMVACFIFLPVTEFTIKSWIIHAVIYAVIIIAIIAAVSFAYFRTELRSLRKYLKHHN